MRAWLICGGLLALLLWPVAVLAQEDDKGYLTTFLETSLSSAGRAVVITGFEGALSARARVQEITIADADGVWLTLRDVALDWDRSALLKGAVSVEALTAGEIVLARLPRREDGLPKAEARAFALPRLPVSVEIRALRAARIVLGESVLGTPLEARIDAALSLAGGEGRADLALTRTDAGPEGRVALKVSYASDTQQLVIDLAAHEAAGGIAARLLGVPGAPQAALSIKGAGPLSAFAADVALQTDGAPRLAGQVRLLGQNDGGAGFEADLGGDLAPLFLPDYAAFFGPSVRLEASGRRWADGRLELSRLTLAARALRLEGAGLIGADGVPARFDLGGRIAAPEGGAVLLPFGGTATRIASADLAAAFDAAVSDRFTLSAAITGLERADFGAAELVLTGSGRIDGGFDGRFGFAAEGLAPADPGLRQALGASVTGAVEITREAGDPALSLPRFTLSGAGYEASGRATIAGIASALAIGGRIEARVDDLARLSGLAGRALGGAARVTLEGSGSPLSGAFDLTASAEGRDMRLGQPQADNLLRGTARVEASVVRDTSGTRIRRFAITAATLAVEGAGQIASAGSALSATLRFGDIGVLGPGFGGALEGRARFQGAGLAGRLTLDAVARGLTVGQAEADRLFAGESRVKLDLGIAAAGVTITEAQVASPQGTVRLSGRWQGGAGDLRFQAALPDLAQIRPGLSGGVAAEGTYRGAPAAALIAATARTKGLRLGVPAADGFLAEDSTINVDLGLKGGAFAIRSASIANPRLEAQASGRWQGAGGVIDVVLARADPGAISGAYGGGISGTGRFEGTLAEGRVQIAALGRDLSLGQPQADALLAGATRLDLDLVLRGGAVQVNAARLDNPQLAARAEGEVTGGRQTLDLTAEVKNLARLLPAFPGALRASGRVVRGPEGTTLALSATGPGQIDARVSGTLAPDLASGDLAIRGTGQAGLANPFLAPRVVSGALGFDLRLQGALSLAGLSGRITLGGGRLVDPAFAVALEEIAAEAELSGGAARLTGASAASRGGRITVSGTVGLAAPNPADLTIAVQNVILRDPDLYETSARGTLRVTGPLQGGALIAGAIALKETELRVPSTGFGNAGYLPGLAHANESPDARATRARAGLIEGAAREAGARPAFALDLAITAPNRVFIRGRGLDAELGGALRLGGTTAAVVPSGAFSLIRGRLDILGKRLDLSEALLQLEGDFVPYLRVVASSENDGITSSVVIEGSATAPEVSFSSIPELPEEEVLAQLFFGDTLTNLSALQAVQLASAIGTLAGRGGDGIVGRLRRGVGLDNLDVKTASDGRASVTAGKYLTRKIYSEVTVEENGQSEINLNFDIRPSVTLRGRAGSDGSTGFGVFLQKDY